MSGERNICTLRLDWKTKMRWKTITAVIRLLQNFHLHHHLPPPLKNVISYSRRVSLQQTPHVPQINTASEPIYPKLPKIYLLSSRRVSADESAYNDYPRGTPGNYSASGRSC
jgi:hypothetical protein